MNWTKESSLYSRKLAEHESDSGSQEKYRITTIKWGLSDYEHTLNIDKKHVHKNTYEMTLEEFITEWMEHFNRHPDEDIIKIEPLG